AIESKLVAPTSRPARSIATKTLVVALTECNRRVRSSHLERRSAHPMDKIVPRVHTGVASPFGGTGNRSRHQCSVDPYLSPAAVAGGGRGIFKIAVNDAGFGK